MPFRRAAEVEGFKITEMWLDLSASLIERGHGLSATPEQVVALVLALRDARGQIKELRGYGQQLYLSLKAQMAGQCERGCPNCAAEIAKWDFLMDANREDM